MFDIYRIFLLGLAVLGACACAMHDATTLTPHEAIITDGAQWSYFTPTSVPPGEWKTRVSPAGWRTGATPIGWGQKGLQTLFKFGEVKRGLRTEFTTELVGAANRYPVAYFRKAIDLPNGLPAATATLRLNCDDGCIVYLNGMEIGRRNLPQGEVGKYNALPETYDDLVVHLPAEKFRKGQNIVAVEVHQMSFYSLDMMFWAVLE